MLTTTASLAAGDAGVCEVMLTCYRPGRSLQDCHRQWVRKVIHVINHPKRIVITVVERNAVRSGPMTLPENAGTDVVASMLSGHASPLIRITPVGDKSEGMQSRRCISTNTGRVHRICEPVECVRCRIGRCADQRRLPGRRNRIAFFKAVPISSQNE